MLFRSNINSINGPDSVCAGTASFNYTASSNGASYGWIIQGGTQVSGGNSGSIGVNWTSANGSISVYAINANGCHSDTLTRNVVFSNPIVNAGPDVAFCSGGNAVLGSAPISGTNYAWSPGNGLSSIVSATPSVSLVNNGTLPL